MKLIHWDDLFDFLERKVNFHKENGDTRWTCFTDLRFTKEFCELNNLSFEGIQLVLANFGGNCDCEVLFNTVNALTGHPITDRIKCVQSDVKESKQ